MPSLDHAVQPRAHGFPDLLGHFEAQAALGARPNDGAGKNMMRRLLERGAEHQHLVGRLARRNFDGKKPRPADRQRPGLVEQSPCLSGKNVPWRCCNEHDLQHNEFSPDDRIDAASLQRLQDFLGCVQEWRKWSGCESVFAT